MRFSFKKFKAMHKEMKLKKAETFGCFINKANHEKKSSGLASHAPLFPDTSHP